MIRIFVKSATLMPKYQKLGVAFVATCTAIGSATAVLVTSKATGLDETVKTAVKSFVGNFKSSKAKDTSEGDLGDIYDFEDDDDDDFDKDEHDEMEVMMMSQKESESVDPAVQQQ